MRPGCAVTRWCRPEVSPRLAIVVACDSGVEYGARRMMEYAKARNLCRVVVVNKIDHDGADCARVLQQRRIDLFDVLFERLPVRAEHDLLDVRDAAAACVVKAPTHVLRTEGLGTDGNGQVMGERVEEHQTLFFHAGGVALPEPEGLVAREPTPKLLVGLKQVLQSRQSEHHAGHANPVDEVLEQITD